MNPFTSRSTEAVASLGEVELLHHIRTWLGSSAPASPYGMGDDTAVLPRAEANLVTTDSLVYGRHFDDLIAPAQAGAKLLKRNLSDIAAMGGSPREAVMAGFLPPSTGLSWLESFTRGLAECARLHNVPIVGGDLTQTEDFLGFNLTLLGYASQPLLRTGAVIGDTLWVTGTLGGSRRRKHTDFAPRLAVGQWLARRGPREIHALIDVTDGLAKDLPALLPEGGAASLDLASVPVSGDALAAAKDSGRTGLEHAFTDGEDYELLFATHAEVEAGAFRDSWESALDVPLHRLGTIVHRPGTALLLDAGTGAALDFGTGYEHFAKP